MNQSYIETPFGTMMNLLSVIPQGHEKALKQAFYNALALFVLILCGAGGWALFYILEPFVKPLIWALLIGSVLHPFKYSLTKKFESLFERLSTSSSPICFGLFMIPIHLIDNISDTIGNAIMRSIKFLLAGSVGILVMFIFYSYIPCVNVVWYIWSINRYILLLIMSNLSVSVMVPLILFYLTTLIFYWKNENKLLIQLGSYGIWLIISLFSAKMFGALEIPLFLTILIMLSIGFTFEVFTFSKSNETLTYWQAIVKVFEGQLLDYDESSKNHERNISGGKSNFSVKNLHASEASVDKFIKENEKEICQEELINLKKEKLFNEKESGLVRSTSDNMNKLKLPTSIEQTFKVQLSSASHHLKYNNSDQKPYREDSSAYIYFTIWACALMVIWKNFWVIHLLPIPIAVYFIKNLGIYFGVWNLLYSQWSSLMEGMMPFFEERKLAIFPPPIQGLYKLTGNLRINLMNGIHYSINSFASSLVILALISFTFFFTLFIIFQIYTEGIHLITVGAGIVNSTVVNNPEFHQLLPKDWGNKLELFINDAYMYGREGLSKQVQRFLKDVDKEKAEEFEKHILELWDRIYQAWLIGSMELNSSIGPKVTSSAVFSSWDNFLKSFHKMPDLFNITALTEFAEENVETFISLLESLWNLLKGNLNLIFQVLFAMVSLVLGGGTVVLNFFISAIVFFTALFYLLSSSGAVYKPVELLSNFSPTTGSKLGVAFEAAVNGVFKASFKMALFYGLWTWLIHNIFQVRIVYLPSVLAAILGAVPFLGTYWASVPAILDLWLAQQKGMQAVALFVFQCLPISFVDTAIYREIKEGHPYMTGLAIAGGVFCMGIQGAIFGPVLLCCLLVALNMSSNLIKDSPTDPPLAPISMHQLRRKDK